MEKKYITTGDIAKELGLSRNRITWYRKIGLLPRPAHTSAGKFDFYHREEVLRRVREIEAKRKEGLAATALIKPRKQ